MGAWTITDTTTTVTFDVDAGDIGYPKERDTNIAPSLAGSRFVTRGPLLPGAPTHGDIMFGSTTDYNIFCLLVDGGHVLTLTDHLGNSFQVLAAKFTPVRKQAVLDRWIAKVEWVGV